MRIEYREKEKRTPFDLCSLYFENTDVDFLEKKKYLEESKTINELIMLSDILDFFGKDLSYIENISCCFKIKEIEDLDFFITPILKRCNKKFKNDESFSYNVKESLSDLSKILCFDILKYYHQINYVLPFINKEIENNNKKLKTEKRPKRMKDHLDEKELLIVGLIHLLKINKIHKSTDIKKELVTKEIEFILENVNYVIENTIKIKNTSKNIIKIKNRYENKLKYKK